MPLHDLIENPARVAELTREDAAQALAELKGLESGLLLRLVAETAKESAPAPVTNNQPDRLIGVEEAAELLGTSAKWLYAHWQELPFAQKLGPKSLRFSANGIQRWIECGVDR